jgi:hypothetical protein
MLAEGGLLGLAAMVVAIAAIGPALVRRRAVASLWALTAFGVASLGSNPTDFAFMVVAAIAWVVYGLPRAERIVKPSPMNGRRMLVARTVLAVVIGIAWCSTWAANVVYGGARDAVAADDYAAAASAIDLARTLDPALPLYARDRATLDYVTGDLTAARERAVEAVRMNERDDVAWRLVALVEDAQGRIDIAANALNAAMTVQRADPTNLLLDVREALEGGETEAAMASLSEVVQAWPTIIFAPEWDSYVGDMPFTTQDIVEAAALRWIAGDPAPERVDEQGLWLLGMSGHDERLDRATAQSGLSSKLADAFVRLIKCEPATAVLDEVPQQDLRSLSYWRLRVRDASVRGVADPASVDMVEFMPRREVGSGGMNPLRENAVLGTSRDVWGYRRIAIGWPAVGPLLPSPEGGRAAWLRGDDCAGGERFGAERG